MPMRAITLVLVTVLLAILAATAVAAPGDLDRSFDVDGIRTVNWGGEGDSAKDVVVQPDGKIVVVGSGFANPIDMGLIRLGTDGSLDTGFAGDGTTSVALGDVETGQGVAVAPDGKIVAVGRTAASERGLVARLLPDGTRDNGFGLTGTQTLEYGGNDGLMDVLVQPDLKIVTVGQGGAGNDLVVTRLIATGLPDAAFNGGGSVSFDFGALESGQAVALQPDGKILAAGNTSAGTQAAVVVRLNANGTPDTSFDGDGRLTVPGPGGNQVRDMLLQPDGKIVLAGFISSDFAGGGVFRVTRLNADGTPDRAFGTNGAANIDFGGAAFATAGALLANGKIVLAGLSGNQAGVVRLQPGGTLDTTFGTGGRATVPGTISHIEGMTLQANGRIVIVGTNSLGTPWDVGVARLDNDSPPVGGGPGGGGPGGGPGGGKSVPRCGGKRATIVGTRRSDRLKGTRRADVIVALGGNDRVSAGRGNDIVCAGTGKDRIAGGPGKDRLSGGSGNDVLSGGSGNDRLSGQSGKDKLIGSSGRDKLSGGPGRDTQQQ